MLPTVTAPTAPPPLPPVPGPVGLLLLLAHPTAAATAPASIQVRMIRMLPPRSKGRARAAERRLPVPGGRAHLICYHRSRQDICDHRCHRPSWPTFHSAWHSLSAGSMRGLRQAIKQRKPFESLQQEVFLEVLRTGHALVEDL